MVATIYLIRHGEPEGGATGRYLGWSDPPLSACGRRRMEGVAAALAAAVPPPGLRAVYSSDLQRAAESAAIVGAPPALTPIVVHGLRERNFGTWEGLTLAQIRARRPKEYEAWGKKPWAFKPKGGEGVNALAARVLAAFGKIRKSHPDGPVAVVAHGGVIRVFLGDCLGMPVENLFRIAQEHGAVNVVEFHEETPVVCLVNGVAFAP